MKIISYNVNGIRAALKKDLIGFLKTQQPDIVGFQELKADENQIPVEEFEALGYYCYWYPAVKKGYSGVSLLTKVKPDHVEKGCGIELYDNEGRIIRADFGDLSILSCYFPSGSSGDERQAIKIDFLADFKNYIDNLKKQEQKLIIMGDYNIAHQAIDVYNPDKAHKMSGYLPEEREWMNKWFADGFVDAFRQIHPNKQEYSWWSYRRNNRGFNRGWRIDYQSVTENIAGKIIECYQLTEAVHSLTIAQLL